MKLETYEKKVKQRKKEKIEWIFFRERINFFPLVQIKARVKRAFVDFLHPLKVTYLAHWRKVYISFTFPYTHMYIMYMGIYYGMW